MSAGTSALPNPTGGANIFTLAADGSGEQLLAILRASPALLNTQDATGYSLTHALASYDRVALLRRVFAEFPALDGNLADSDGETPLFVVETVGAAQFLVEELGVDRARRNGEDQTAEEKIREEGEFVVVADYLGEVRKREGGDGGSSGGGSGNGGSAEHPPPLPPGVRMELATVPQQEDEEGGEALPPPDPEFRKRIEELAARDDFQSEDGQRQLKELIQDAVRGVGSEERDVRRRTD